LSVLRCDMHVHSYFSCETSRWVLRSLKAPESFTPPELIYHLARKRGMDLVTITDINNIDGSLEIVSLPGAFISEEVRTLLPSKTPIHLLVYGLTPDQHDIIVKKRDRFLELVEYLKDQGLVHSLAHPFYFPGSDLTPDEFEMVVTNVELVEAINGTRAKNENEAVMPVVRAARMDDGFTGFTAGSDDHCGRFIGLSYTTVEDADDYLTFLERVRDGYGVTSGSNGSAIRSAYSVYSIAYSFYRERLTAKKIPAVATLAADRFFRPSVDDDEPTVWHKADFLFHQMLKKAKKSGEPDFETFLADELIEIGKDLNLSARSPKLEEEGIDERTFEILNRLTNRLLQHYISLLVKRVGDGRFLDALEAFTALVPVFLLNFPYPIAYLDRKRGRDSVDTISEAVVGIPMGGRNPEKRAWFTDTIDDLNGVSRTLQKFSRLAVDSDRELAVITCQSRPLSFPGWVVNFPPLREFAVPDYHSKLLSIPPFLEILRFMDENDFGMMYISTPGPMGFAALGISKLLGIPSVGIYHTDYPRHVNHIVQDARMGEFAGAATAWFYGHLDRVLVPSRYYIEDLKAMGIPEENMDIFPRGTDSDTFSPEWRDEDFFTHYGGHPGTLKLLYVGRVSREKDLDVLAEAFLKLREKRDDIELFIVGDGPYIHELSTMLSGHGGYFCGLLSGENLSKAYASADIFVFPSTTDTYGNSVLEAQASGLPAIVTDMGGPQEIIKPEWSGLIYSGRDVNSLLEVVRMLIDEPGLRERMAREGREIALSTTWPDAFDAVWGNALPGSGEKDE
jgi:glycosyltransferase involved in cell wall biosynthesis/predicted metal-dependent phosphoesterase TrpH